MIDGAIRRNTLLDVTSALYSDGACFFHTIEGEEPALAKLMSSILRDQRHFSTTILDQTDLADRRFPGLAVKHIDGSRDDRLRERFSFGSVTLLGADYVAERVRDLARAV